MVKDMYHTHNNQKRAHVAILLTDTISTKKKVVTRDKKKHFIIKKRVNPPKIIFNYKHIHP